jgi:SpoVK/Ycf46/Vps4 family AAA+-type ATPase
MLSKLQSGCGRLALGSTLWNHVQRTVTAVQPQLSRGMCSKDPPPPPPSDNRQINSSNNNTSTTPKARAVQKPYYPFSRPILPRFGRRRRKATRKVVSEETLAETAANEEKEKEEELASSFSEHELSFKQLQVHKEIDVTLDNFPYHMNTTMKEVLLTTAYLYIARPAMQTPLIKNSGFLLEGPRGTEMYQEALTRALAHHLKANFLVMNPTSPISAALLTQAIKKRDGSDSTVVFLPDAVNINYADQLVQLFNHCHNHTFLLVGASSPKKVQQLSQEAIKILKEVYQLEIKKIEPVESDTKKYFATTISIFPPTDIDQLVVWQKQIQNDVEKNVSRFNMGLITTALQKNNIVCDEDIKDPFIKQHLLSKKQVEDILRWAIGYKEMVGRRTETPSPAANATTDTTAITVTLQDVAPVPPEIRTAVAMVTGAATTEGSSSAEPATSESKASETTESAPIKLTPTHIQYALGLLKDIKKQEHSNPLMVEERYKIETDDPFEKRLLPHVIIPEQMDVSFRSIGALQSVKDSLYDLVIAPLVYPNLFSKGILAKGISGVLLFGPPGTGKTMLAKALARESRAAFINLSMGTLASKWYGETEKSLLALFNLAKKLSPCIIFIDEIDGFLSQRGEEHEVTRRVKNDFMAAWDGLKSSDPRSRRILVLGATNRPFDLDEAALRRLPKRILVDIPSHQDREAILKVLLKDENLAPDVTAESIAKSTEGYTGSDLKNLTLSACHHVVRQHIKTMHENVPGLVSADGFSEDTEVQIPNEYKTPRAVTMADFLKAKEEIQPSVSEESQSVRELRKWNQIYGIGSMKSKGSIGFGI